MRISDWSSDVCSSDLAARGVLRGFGIGIYVENDGGVPAEFADVGVEADEDGRDGAVTLRVGTQDFGMGHATMYAQVIADELGEPFRSEERRLGKESVRLCCSRGLPYY